MDSQEKKSPEQELKTLLAICTNPDSPDWQQGWQQFFAKYKKFIYGVAYRRCIANGNSRMQAQLEAQVEDIVAQVIQKLLEKNYKALRDYQNLDMASLFYSYLAKITNWVTIRYLDKQFKSGTVLFDANSPQEIKAKRGVNIDWEWFDHIVSALRNALGKHNDRNERKVHLYMMFYYGDMPADAITSHPFYRSMSNEAFHTTINRITGKIKNNM